MRSFGETTVLAGVDVVLEPGGVFGLLGPNGAGKTTTVRILTGLLHPYRVGCLRVRGEDLTAGMDAVRPHIGVQTDTALYDGLTGLENLTFFGRLYGMVAAHPTSAARAPCWSGSGYGASAREVRIPSGHPAASLLGPGRVVRGDVSGKGARPPMVSPARPTRYTFTCRPLTAR